MSITVFGVTAQSIRDHHFPQLEAQAFSAYSRPTSTAVGEMVDEAAAELAGKLAAEDITAADITSGDYPVAYAWCRATVRLSAALRVLRAMANQDPEVAKAWQTQLDARYAELAAMGAVALGDAPLPSQPSNGPRSHVSAYSLDTGDDEDLSTLEPKFRRDDLA